MFSLFFSECAILAVEWPRQTDLICGDSNHSWGHFPFGQQPCFLDSDLVFSLSLVMCSEWAQSFCKRMWKPRIQSSGPTLLAWLISLRVHGLLSLGAGLSPCAAVLNRQRVMGIRAWLLGDSLCPTVLMNA